MRKTLLILSLGLFFLVQAGGICWSQTTERVSVDSVGDDSNGASNLPSISSDGRYVAFESFSTNLVTGGTNGKTHIFVRDRQTGITTLVSVDSGGTEGDQGSRFPSISGDGGCVAFESQADNLVPGDTNAFPFSDIFVHDLGGATTLVSVDSAGAQDPDPSSSFSPSLSSNGRYVAFESDAITLLGMGNDTNGSVDIFVHDRDTDGDGIYDEPGAISTIRVSVDSAGNEVNEASVDPSISADGRYVAFSSFAADLVAFDNNGKFDIFVHDRDADGDGIFDEPGAISTIRVSVASGGGEATGDSNSPSISADGRYVAFDSDAADLVGSDNNGISDIFVYERESLPPTVDSTSPTHSANGVAVKSSITATFSEPMNGSSIDTNTFTLDNGVTGTVTYDANTTTASFTPTSNLHYNTTYTATITTAAEDLAGNPMQTDYTWSFTTESEKNNNSSVSISCFIATAASYWVDF